MAELAAVFEPSRVESLQQSTYWLLQRFNATVTNPGTPGDMVSFGLRKYRPHSDLVRSRFGFDADEYFRSALTLLGYLQHRLAPELEGRSPHARFPSSSFIPREMESPPAGFDRTWTDATTFTDARAEELEPFMLHRSFIRFLSSRWEGFGPNQPSFSRWAFLDGGGGSCVLMLPGLLIETAVSALHVQLVKDLPDADRSRYGNKVGDTFAATVDGTIRAEWAGVTTRQKVHGTAEYGDTDIEVSLPSGLLLHVQCKGGMISPYGRWWNPRRFEQAVESVVAKAADQAYRMTRQPDSAKPYSVWVVLDAYLPGFVAHTQSVSHLRDSLARIPHPLVLTCYELRYLLSHVSMVNFPDYLEWRDAFLNSGHYQVADEFDLTCAYLHRERLFPKGVSGSPTVETFIGEDQEYGRFAMLRAVKELGIPGL